MGSYLGRRKRPASHGKGELGLTEETGRHTDLAKRFSKVRDDHRSETAEDYVELIADLVERHGEARVVDIAACLGVSSPTVNKILFRLREEGLVTGRRYRGVFLTEKGQALAQRVRTRHGIVVRFLQALGVAEQIAEADAEGIEHHVSDETLAAFCKIVAAAEADSSV